MSTTKTLVIQAPPLDARRRWLRAWTVAALAGGGLLPVFAQNSVKIGVIAPFNTPPGDGLLNAARMAAEDINAAGGIGGRKLELMIANDEYKPDGAANAYKKLALSDKVVAVVGTASSGAALAVIDQMLRYRVPFVSTGAATLQLSERVSQDYGRHKYWFRVMHTTQEMAGALSDFAVRCLLKEKGYRRAAILAENAVWAKGLLPALKQNLEQAGVQIVADEGFDVDTKDFKPLLSKIMRTDPQYIIDLSSHVDGAIYVKQWGELQGPPMFGVNASGASTRFWKDTEGRAVSHMNLMTGSQRVALTPKTIPWYDRYVTRYKVSPDYTSGYTYDALFLLKQAIEKGGSEPDKLVAAMEASDHVGVVARWAFEKNHNARFGPGFRAIGVNQWRPDGERSVVWPPEVRTEPLALPPWKQ
ncbi:ABC transporter substrate-binding protein [Roseateles sp. DB2]|uniref:ABC transporter substrate-binding protein n=1 Tax=Roseateles sp. DB2 TaxID=3453717 RepID=UPI003EEBC7E8